MVHEGEAGSDVRLHRSAERSHRGGPQSHSREVRDRCELVAEFVRELWCRGRGDEEVGLLLSRGEAAPLEPVGLNGRARHRVAQLANHVPLT
ncbi:hypothetical protein DEI98_07980 [Curtobacterium sp. MCLR17_034]|nr:hypothetical protein DEI98_07980 [Curtobacterium sp. MCLR17_034]